MRLRHFEVLIMLLITAVCLCTCIFVLLTQQREIERLNRDVVAARQEVAAKTNRIYELNLKLEGRK